MKNTYISIATLLITSFYATFAQVNSEINQLMENENNYDYKEQKELWIESMHLVEPDINWRVIESQNRQAKHDQILSKKNENYLLSDEITGGGYLKGKWIEKGSNNQAGRIHTADIDFERNLIYAASSGGNIWRGSADGTGWTCLNNSLQISNIRLVQILNINGKNRIFVAGNGPAACYYSDDEGLNWNRSAGLGGPAKWGSVARAAYCGKSRLLYVLANEWDYSKWKSISSLYVSANSGDSFALVTSSSVSTALCDIWSDRYNGENLYFSYADTLSSVSPSGNISYLSGYNGMTQFKNMTQILMAGAVSGNSTYLGAMLNNGDGSSYFFSSTDGGVSWTPKGNVSFSPFEKNSFAISSAEPDSWFCGGVEVYKSSDGGTTWHSINGWGEYYGNPKSKLHADIPGIKFFNSPQNNEIMLIGTDGGLYISDDLGTTVKNISLRDLNVSQYYSSYTYENAQGIIFAGAQDQGFQRCLNDSGGTLSFQQTISGDYGQLVSADGGDHLWSVYPGFAMLYAGASETKFSTYTWDLNKNNCKNWLWMPPTCADLSNPNGVYIAAGGIGCADASKCSYMFHLIFDGAKISNSVNPFNFGADGSRLSAIGISPLDKNTMYALTSNGSFYYSTDKGTVWNQTIGFKGPEPHYFYGSTILPSAKKTGRLFIAGSGYSNPAVYVSDDNGKTFSRADSGLPKTLVYKLAASDDENYIFAATESGPYVYFVPAGKWFPMSTANSPDQTFWSVEYVSYLKTARYVTYGRGIWDFKVSEFLTGIPELNENNDLSIEAFPNPFENDCRILIKSWNITDALVQIFDYDGRLISNLFDGKIPAGSFCLKWDGATPSGQKAQKGVYILTLKSMGKAWYAKLVLK